MASSSGASTRGSRSGVRSSAPTPLASFKAQERTRATMQHHNDQIEFIHTRLQLDLQAIEHELRADRDAQVEYEKQLARLAARKAELRRTMATQREFIDHFDEQIGPFEARYAELQRSVDGLHREARGKYDAAVQLLVDKLGYHPPFKRHNDIL